MAKTTDLFPDCVLCAAGRSGRMGDFKPFLPWKEGTVLDAALESALQASARVILVTGYRSDELEQRYGARDRIVVVHNKAWSTGLVSSIRLGAAQVRTDRFFVALADMPLVSPELYRSLDKAFSSKLASRRAVPVSPRIQSSTIDPMSPLALRPRIDGINPGHPVLFSASVLPFIASFPDGESLKPVLDTCDLCFLDTQEDSCMEDLDDLSSYLSGLIRHGQSPEGERKGVFCRIYTGLPGSGKTTALRREYFRALTRGIPACLISQVQVGTRDVRGRAEGFDMELIAWTGASDCLHRRIPLARGLSANTSVFTLALGTYHFDPRAFAEAALFYSDFINNTKSSDPKGRFIALDELGRLELLGAGGLIGVFDKALQLAAEDRGKGYPLDFVCAARLETLDILKKRIHETGFPFLCLNQTVRYGI